MPKIKYKDKNIRAAGLAKIEQVNAIIDEYHTQGYTLTLRQIYYVFVSKGLIPNTYREYDNLGNLIKNGREVGLIDWHGLEDRTRELKHFTHWKNPSEIISAAADSYRIDLWQYQPFYLEVWIEKDALLDVARQAADPLDIACFACRGYGSATSYWEAAQRIKEYSDTGRSAIILHLGDLDPSGADMTRDIQARLNLYGANVEIKRIALNMPQVEEYNPPPQPAKEKDTRSDKFIAQYGKYSWELDALEPRILDELIKSHISNYLDMREFQRARNKQEREREQLLELCVQLERAATYGESP